MTSRILVFLGLIVSMACQQKKNEAEATADSTTVATTTEPVQNQLTDQQKAEGWVALFDGSTMNGWHFFKHKENDSWEIVDGAFHCKPFVDGATNKRADITTNEQYENFELSFDFNISAQANSGVMFRVSEEFDEPYASGPEYQVVDDIGYPGDHKDVYKTAANYDMQATGPKKLNPAGEWNTGKIVVNGNHVEHWLNGDKVLEYELGSEAWKKLRDGSKWKDFKGYGQTKKGYIDFQDHGNEVWYRNIFLKPL